MCDDFPSSGSIQSITSAANQSDSPSGRTPVYLAIFLDNVEVIRIAFICINTGFTFHLGNLGMRQALKVQEQETGTERIAAQSDAWRLHVVIIHAFVGFTYLVSYNNRREVIKSSNLLHTIIVIKPRPSKLLHRVCKRCVTGCAPLLIATLLLVYTASY